MSEAYIPDGALLKNRCALCKHRRVCEYMTAERRRLGGLDYVYIPLLDCMYYKASKEANGNDERAEAL